MSAPDCCLRSDTAIESGIEALERISSRHGLPSAARTRQTRTLSSVIYSVGVFVILFLAAMQILSQVNINVGPRLASAGITGLVIGAQTPATDFINRFFILGRKPIRHRQHYDRGVQGILEAMIFAVQFCGGNDEAVHTVPSARDPWFAKCIVGTLQVPGIKRVSGNKVDWQLLVKTKPGRQVAVSRESRLQTKTCLDDIEPGNPSRMDVVEA